VFLSRRICLGAGSAKTKLTSLDVSRNCLGRQGAAALAAGLDEGQLGGSWEVLLAKMMVFLDL